jgi:predicted GIY-YIG superfamily endonuclease
MDHECWTYIVASLNRTLYIGMTNNIERRMWEHKSGAFEGFASKYRATGWFISRGLTMFVMPLIARSSSRGGAGRRRLL